MKNNDKQKLIQTPKKVTVQNTPAVLTIQDAKRDLDLDPGIHNAEFITSPSPDELDEQSVAGSATDPEADDDTLQNAQMMGMQMEEDTEHPEELDIARDIDKAEKFVHE